MISGQRGFTLPELLVVGAMFVGLAVTALIFVHPKDFSSQQREAERWVEISQIAHALKSYAADHGKLPDGVDGEEGMIGSDEGTINLCTSLVPGYLKDMPVDPFADAENPGGAICREGAPAYLSGYSVQAVDSTVTVKALLAESKEELGVTVTF